MIIRLWTWLAFLISMALLWSPLDVVHGTVSYPGVTTEDIDAMYDIVSSWIDHAVAFEEVGDFLVGALVRLVFHDCIGPGGCDGCINLAHPHNGGLEVVVGFINDLYNHPIHKFNQKMSRADFWMIVGTLAARKGADNQDHNGRNQIEHIPEFEYFYGRTDCGEREKNSFQNPVPGGNQDFNMLFGFFKENFDFTQREMVALLGAHTLGRAKRLNSGFFGIWVRNGKGTLDNQYFIDLVDRDDDLKWKQNQIGKGFWQWQYGPDNVPGSHNAGVMLDVDMCLFKKIRLVDNLGQSDCTYDACPAAETADIVREYASDNKLWLDDFAAVWTKLVQQGYRGTPKENCLVKVRPKAVSPGQGQTYEATCAELATFGRVPPPVIPDAVAV